MTPRRLLTLYGTLLSIAVLGTMLLALTVITALAGAVYYYQIGHHHIVDLCIRLAAGAGIVHAFGLVTSSILRRARAAMASKLPIPEAPYAHVGDDGRLYRDA